jgi:tetratricopeptide (TPR) repeat protein
MILRDAVDAEPFDLPRREALIKLLNETGHPDLAAAEAARASALNPASGGFRLEGARSALAAGNLDGAATAAKDALAHDPKNADAHLVLGEVSLFRLEYPAAIADFDAACTIGPTTEAVYYRAIAKAFSGDVPGAAADGESAHHGSVVQPVPPYDTTIKLFDAAVQGAFDGVRNLLPNVALGTNAQDLSASVAKIQSVATASAGFLTSWQSSKTHAPSHERRILALKLLAQACGEIVGFLAKRDDEALTDARIDLGEAMKQYKSAKDLFVGEAAE